MYSIDGIIITESDVERFWTKVAITANPEKCWEWQRGREKKMGYGRFWHNRDNIPSHKFSYIISNKKPTDELFVLHKCDNPCCVNPNHLFLGTNADNMRDKIAKNRHWKPKGELSPVSKLKNKDVLKIRSLYRDGMKQYKIAELFKMSNSMVSHIIKRKSWKHI